MNKTKIDWCDSTWNPVTGCLHGCEYCYARSIANRFGCHAKTENDVEVVIHPWENSESGKILPYPFDFHPTFHKYRLSEYQNKKGRNIFVCSMADLFGSWVPDSWINEVMTACEAAPQHNYLFLTKNPERYEQYGVAAGNGNVWYGTSITRKEDIKKAALLPLQCKRFVSIEPLLEDIEPEDDALYNFADWFIIGAETGRRKNKVITERKWIEDIVNECRKNNKPVFMKSSLAAIWDEPLIKEFPKQLSNENEDLEEVGNET